MILKQIRISKYLSQEQLAEMSGLNVRTIQRIESGHNASVESLKCIASALDVDIQTLTQEKMMIDKSSDNWKAMSPLMKAWFMLNFLQSQPRRNVSVRIEVMSHVCALLFCVMGINHEGVLVGGILFLINAHLFRFLTWQGDKYGIWYQTEDEVTGR